MTGDRRAAPIRRSHPRRLLGIAGLAVIAFTGCAGGAGGGGVDPNSDAAIAALGETLHPTGDPRAWFWDSYRNGLAGAYSTSNEICGIGRDLPADLESDDVLGDIVVESVQGPGLPRVIGRSLSAGTIMWELPEVSCQDGAVVDDTVVVSGLDGGDWQSLLVSTRTGRTIMRLPSPDDAAQSGYAEPIVMGGAEDAMYDPAAARLFAVSGTTIMSVSPPDPDTAASPRTNPQPPTGTLDWATEIGAEIDPVPLGGGMIGVTQRLSDRIWIVDGVNGEVAFETELADKHDLTWLSDGYLIRENESDPAYVFSDLDGTEVERTVGASQYGFVPGPRQGITYSIADQLAAGTTVGVDAAGRPALVENPERKDQLRGATVGEGELPDSIISLQGVSRDGSLLLFPRDSRADSALPGIDGDSAVVIDQRGAPVIEWPLADSGVSVMAGYIVARDGNSSHVLLPQRP